MGKGTNPTLARARMGAPLKLTPETHGKIVGYIKEGAYLETAAAAAGIHKSTLYDWLRRGETGEEPFASFSADMQREMALLEIGLLRDVRAGDKDTWRAAMTVLERRFPKRWGSSQELILKRPDSPTREAYDAMTDDELEAEARRVLEEGSHADSDS